MTLVQHEIKAVYTWTGNITDMRWPCPEGFHVPSKDERQAVYDAGVSLWAWTSTWANNASTYLKLPKNWFLNSPNSIVQRGGQWYYRSSTSNEWTSAKCLLMSGNNLNPASWVQKYTGWNLRAIKDSAVMPDNSWTTLYSWTWDAGIFWDSTNWLISISSDWTTRYTIADKNLWATVVYNYWDTMSADNCWYYYQRWNNNGFAWSGSVTWNTTQVDASNYWPWNYYSSNVFRYNNNNWDSSNNTNLRWWVTWVLTEHKIRPSYKREPTADTIAYYPLNWDANDYSWNNRNLTTNGVTYSETIANGNKCWTFTGVIRNNGSKWWEWTSWVSMSNANMTLSVRAKTTGNWTDSTYWANKWMLLYFQDSWRNYWQTIKTAHWTTWYIAAEWWGWGSSIWTSAETPTPYADWQWHHFCATYTISSVKLFVDWQLVSSWTGSFTAVTTNYNIYVGKDTTSYNYYWYAGQMSEVIFEKATWTDADVLEYYNWTKSNYWL